MNGVFQRAFMYLLKNEGLSYTDNPADSGGLTKFGITKGAYQIWVGHEVGEDEIKAMTIDTASSFYYSQFWQALSCDKMDEDGTAIAIFDTAVLYGPGTAGVMAQKAVNECSNAELKLDGILGDNSLAALNVIVDADFLESFHKFVLERIDWVVQSDPKNETFRLGWVARANRLLTLAAGTAANS